MHRTKRVKIVTGLKCNIRCVFCYYRDNLKMPNRQYEKIVRDLHYAWKHGVRQVDFSGGEPTVHPDLPRLITEAKKIGMERVCIITNGLKLADKKYAEILRDAGIDETLFSLHGSNPDIHEKITTVRGSFKRIIAAIENMAELGVKVRTNTVVNRLNYNNLNKIAQLIIRFNPIQVNFITLNDWCYAKHLVDKLMLSYEEMAPVLQEACDVLSSSVPIVNVRYIPFCFMREYEKFVCNHKQIMYDPFEWVPRIRARLEEQNNIWRWLGIMAYGYTMGGAYKKTFKFSFTELMDESVVEALRHWFYTKSKVCTKCRLNYICDGIENSYANAYGTKELLALVGPVEENPLCFRS